MNKLFFLISLFPFVMLGQMSLLEVSDLIDQKKFGEAEAELHEHLRQDSSNKLAREYLGDVQGHLKNWDKAIEYYEVLANEEPRNANYQYKYGGSMGMKALTISKIRAVGYIGDMRRAFEKAAELDPKHIDARWALVEFNMSVPGILGGTEKNALKYADQLEQLSKVDGYLAKGYVAEYSDRPNDAERYYRKAIDVGGSVTCYQKLTDFYEKTMKQPEKAIANIEKAQIKHKRNALHYQIGKVAAEYNVELDKGEQCLKIYLANHSAQDGVPKSWAYYRLAQINRHKGQKEEALKWVNTAIKSKPDLKPALKEKELIQSM